MNYDYGVSVPIKKADATLMQQIAEAGFRNVELFFEGDDLDNEKYPDIILPVAESTGLKLVSLHSTGWNNCSGDREEREASVRLARRSIQVAPSFGIPTVIVHPSSQSGATTFTEEHYDANRSRGIQSLIEFAEEGAKAGVRLAVENLPARHTARPGARMDDLLDMIAGLGEHVGICHDVGHSNANGQNAAEEARMAGELIFAMHLQDNDGAGEDQHLLPEEGTTDWQALVGALSEIDYTAGRIIEVRIDEDDPSAFLHKLHDTCCQWH